MSSCGQAVVGEIHRAVGADVALDAGEQREAVEPRVDLADRARVRERARLVEAVRHRERLAVVGDREVAQAGRLRGARHRLDVVAAVGRGGVAVQVPLEIGELHQAGQRARSAASISPRFSRSSGGTKRGRARRRCRLRLAGDARVVVDAVQPVLVQLQAALDRAVAQDDVVGLGAGEVLQRGAEALARHEPQVRLEAAPEPHARLRLAVREHPLDQLVAGERVHQRRWRAGGEDVEVAAGLAAAAEAADHRCRRRARARAARRPAGGRVVRLRHQPPADEPPLFLERLEDQRLLLRAHALHAADAAVARRLLELLERADAELAVEPRDRLRPDALEVQQVQHGRRKLLQQFLVIRMAPVSTQLADLRGEVLADPRQRQPLGRRQPGDARASRGRWSRRRSGTRGS